MKRLSVLLKDVSSVSAEADRDISGLTLDSRQVMDGYLFLAVKGTQLAGGRFIRDAVTRGAAAVLIDADTTSETIRWEQGVPVIAVAQLQKKMHLLAAGFYDHPADKLKLIGVTGTNGKTSCTHFIAQIMQSQQMPCGIVGTLGCGMYGDLVETGLTTPDVVTLQKKLDDFVQAGAKVVAMEVSSHGIDQGRVDGLAFDIGVFTNLTQDHLDYHGTMEAYADVKFRFLNEFSVKHLIINADDACGASWAARLAEHRSVYTFSVSKLETAAENAIYCENVKLKLTGIQANVCTPWGHGQLVLPLVGQFNLSNALASLAALCISGIPLPAVLTAFRQIKPVPGRMQSLGGNGKPVVVVDYAHTPDALEKTLQALRHHTPGKLICVFGCGGDRDPAKRPLMAKIAESGADRVFVTNDNPRREDPEKILHDIMQGFGHPSAIEVELDRAKAIQKSIQSAAASDCVLIAGKGAEHYQQIGDNRIPFDDVVCAEEWLAKNEALEK